MSKHPFERFSGGQDALYAMKAEQFEASRVEFLLKRSGFSNVRREINRLYDEHMDDTGVRKLTFKTFNRVYESYPILLGANNLAGVKLHTDPRAMLPAMFKKFDAVPFVTAYEEFFGKVVKKANGRSIGLVFPRKGIVGGLLIFNGGLEAVDYRGTTIEYTGGPDRKHRFRLYVRPFRQMVEAIHNKGHGWCPE